MEQLNPTPEIRKEIFQIMDIEMKDLKENQGEEFFIKEDQTFKMLCHESGMIRDKVNDSIVTLQKARKSFKKTEVSDPEALHRDFTDIYSSAEEIAAMSVRLMAIARMGIISSVSIGTIDGAR